MAKSKKSKKEISLEDYVKANRRGSREAEMEYSTGFRTVHKTHKSEKNYSRKGKNAKVYAE